MDMKGVFKSKKTGKWYIDYRLPNGKRRRETIGDSRKLAEAVLRKRKVEIAENKYLDVRRDLKIKFEDFADEYFEKHCKVNNRSWDQGDTVNIKTLKSFFSGKYLYEITPSLVEEFKAKRIKTKVTDTRSIKPSTVNRNLACLKSLFNKAIAWGKYSGVNPAKAVKLFKENNKRLRYLEREEISRLLHVSKGYLRLAIVLALNTGMRRGEILGLKWKDLDFRRGIIYLCETKNGYRREIPMNHQVNEAFLEYKENPESQYVFCHKDGAPILDIKKSFSTALNNSGITDFRFHDLRHTAASYLVMAGVDLNTVREILGHKSLQMTLRYSHLSPGHVKKAVDVLSKDMDTIWTPKAIVDGSQKSDALVKRSESSS